MTASVHSIGEARKARSEKGETMHYADPKQDQWRNANCPHCRICSICKDSACNRVVDGVMGDDHGHVWTDDLGTWAGHTNPCVVIPLLGSTSPEAGGGDG